jgi:tRNA pseudouridine38-40 synthase
MNRYFIHLAYNGANYHGWQYQPNAITVQEVLNKAFSLILRENIELTGAGRTDTGVHARSFFAHFDSTRDNLHSDSNFTYKLNGVLPKDIVVYNILLMQEDAHARFDATAREYKYYISQKKEIFQLDTCWQFYPQLSINLMNEAANLLIKHTDFTSFSKLHTDVKTNDCDVRFAQWAHEGHLLVFTIEADRFLRNMVRSIVGTLIEVGLGKRSVDEFNELIKLKDRNIAGPSAPARGLFLENISYPYKTE